MSKEENRTEKTLTASEHELRLLEEIPTLVWRAGPEGNIEYVNQRVLDYFGAPLGEVVGWAWMEKVHPDDVAFKVRTWLQNLESGNPHDVLCRFRGADGRYRWFEVRGESLRASDGTVLSWSGVLIDIDDRRKTEEALRQSEYKLRQIIETVPSLLWSLGPDGEQTQLNQRALDYIGVRFEDLQHLGGWTKFVHPDDLPETANAFYHSIQTGSSYQAVHRLRRADGEFRWHHSRGEPLRDRQGRVLQWYGLTVDIDEGKRAEGRLRRSETYLAEAQRLSHTGSFGWTPSTGELHWSDEIFRILEYDPSIRPTIERVLERIHPDDLAMVRRVLDETSRGEKNFDTTHRLSMPDGSVKFVHVLSRVLKDATGNLEIAGALMDVTENTLLYRDLGEREAKIRRLVEANIIGVFLGDFDGRILEANDAFLRIVGYGREDLATGRINWKDLTPPDWRQRDAQWINEHKRTGVRLPIEKEYFRKDGSRVPILLGSATFKGGGNQSVAFVLDLTERKQAERAARLGTEALRRSEARLAEAQRLTHIGVAAYNETAILYGSEETYRIWGFDPAQGVPSREAMSQRVHPDDRGRLDAEVRRALGEKRRYSIGYRIILPDGTMKHLESIGEPQFSATGELVEIVATQIDVTERKRAEQALRESEYKLRQIIEAVPGLVWSTGPDGEPTYANQRLLDYTGTRLDDFKNRKWERFLHPDDLPEFVKAVDHAIQTGTSWETVHRLRRSNGGYRWHHARMEPLRDRQAQIIQWYGLSVDIDEGKKAEDQLRRSEAYLAEAQALSQTGSAAYNNSTILYWSEETYRILGFDPRDGLPTYEAVAQRTHPDDQERVREQARRAVEQKRDYKLEYRILLPAGPIKHIEMNAHPKFSISGELVEVVSTIVDVTERKRAQQAIQRSQFYLSEGQRLAHMGSWAFNPSGFFEDASDQRFPIYGLDQPKWALTPFEYWSEENYRIWGLDPQQGLPNHEALRQRIHPGDRDRVYEQILDAWRHNRDYALEFRIVLPDGTVKYLEATSHPVSSARGKLVEVVGTHLDVTERKRAREEHERLRQLESDLAHMNRVSMMGELAASLAHEITQPIAAARNNARAALNFLDKQPSDLGEVREALGCVVGDADRAGIIIDRMRDQVKKAPPRKHRFDLNEAINEVIVLARSAIAENGVSVQTRLSEGLAPVEGDRVQLQQVILNLVLNAAEAMSMVDRGARQLFISTEQGGAKGVLVAVRDSGPGIDPKHIERVFDAFYTTKSSGVGMGLSICRSIIEAHSGRLWADANEFGGAAFQFTLPGAEGFMNSLHAAHQNGAPPEDNA
jgi:PAS domain S-box-containing protein